MANIVERNGSYKITVSGGYTPDGKQKRFVTTWTPAAGLTGKKIEKALNEFVVDYERKCRSGKCVDGNKMTLSEYAEYYMSEYASENYTASSYDYARRGFNDVLPKIGHLKLSELAPLHVQQALSALKKSGRSYSILRRAFSTLRGSLNIAIDLNLMGEGSNPCTKAVKPAQPKKKKNPAGVACFDLSQAQAFLWFIEQPYSVTYCCGRKPTDGSARKTRTSTYEPIALQMRLFFNMALYGGMRRGELIALKWHSVDFANGFISVTESTERLPEGGQGDKDPKTESSIRTVEMPPVVMDMLKKHRKAQKEYRLSLGSAWQGSNYLFTQANGKQMSLGTPGHAFKKALKRYSETVKDSEPLADVSLHALRHTSATLAIAANMDVVSVSRRLGHSQVSTTMNIYSHYLKEADRKIAAAMQDMLGDTNKNVNKRQISAKGG
jgi:integrase